VSEYERALAVWPGAQSSSAALAAALIQQDQREQAFSLVRAALARPMRDDPWRTYGQGPFREWLELLNQVRGFVR